MTLKTTREPALKTADWPRFNISPTALSALIAAVLLAGYNRTFWSNGAEIFAGHFVQLALFGLVVFLLTLSFFSVFSFRLIVRPFLALMLLISAVTSYYMDNLGTIIDREMIQNVVTTTVTESKHLFSPHFALHVFAFGVIPSVALFFVPVKKHKIMMAIGAPAGVFVLSLALAAGLLMVNLKTYASVLREHRVLAKSYQPGAPLVGAIRYAKMVARTTNIVVAPIGTDATKGEGYQPAKKPVLTIIFAGETARAQNFSLNGYDRPTNPELSQKAVFNFSDVNSCGTATAVSLPCMFSSYTRDTYSFEKGVSTEALLDVLDHAGFAVEWWDNNTGDKGIAARVGSHSVAKSENAVFCSSGECDDGIFLEHLKAFVPTITQDTVLVLHQIGSHGPAYYLRYPAEREVFKPTCRTVDFTNCTPEEVINAYDNTIAYTDHVLAQMIDFLAAQNNLSTSMVYVSDHGESLGEGGVYLHGAPYFMAPEEQTKVPMLFWMSDAFLDQFGINSPCLRRKQKHTASHDNLFHSVLGMLDVQTAVYHPDLDLFAGCTAQKQLVSK